jgi:Spy/CpxP family protein refolding chaperone
MVKHIFGSQRKEFSMTIKHVLLAVLCVSLAGCGSALSRSAAAGDATSALSNPYTLQATDGTTPNGQHHGQRQLTGLGLVGGRLAGQLNLTDDQKARLKALVSLNQAEGDGAADSAARKAARAGFERAWKADPLDTTALKAQLDKRQADALARLQKHIEMMAAAREVLTQAQREQLAALMEAQADKPRQHAANGHHQTGRDQAGDGQPQPKQGRGFGHQRPVLTADERAKVTAFIAQRRAGQKVGDRLRTLAAFMRSGDKVALAAALTPKSGSADLLAFASSLSAGERADLTRVAEGLVGIHGGAQHLPRGQAGHRRREKPAASTTSL